MIALLAAVSCAPPVSSTIPRRDSGHVRLSELPFTELRIPADSHGGEPPPERVTLEGPWRNLGLNARGRQQWAARLPVRPRGLFFYSPEPGMHLLQGDGSSLAYDLGGKADLRGWSHNRDEIVLYLDPGEVPPTDLQLEWPTAVARERALNQQWSDAAPEQFVWTTAHHDLDSREGLLLPAPGEASWRVVVPAAAELRFTAGLIAPELRTGPGSDGARLVATITTKDGSTVVFSEPLESGVYRDHRADLTAWAGQEVELRLTSEPGLDARYDYVFVGAPTLASRLADPRRVVLIFVDTLRPDHLSTYGYRRDTSVAIDAWAREGVVFENARSVAPWTLPSARSVMTGRQPEYYQRAETMPAILGRAGFATAFFAGNVYLSSSFDMQRGWDLHEVAMLPLASQTTDSALAWLAANPNRDVLLQVHYMSTHLPYLEPESYRTRYANAGEAGLKGEVTLNDVRRANLSGNPAGQAYLRDRYDGTIRYTTDQIRRLLDVLTPEDIVVFFSDHGEEFWEHGGLEHGHTLYDELLRVPLIVRAPGLPPGRVAEPVSLLDILPTVLDLLDLPPPPEVQGKSLIPVANGDSAVVRDRSLSFGHPLYGEDRWGVLHGAMKWMSHDGVERVYDLTTDPAERNNVAARSPLAPWHLRLAEGVGRAVASAWRLTPAANGASASTPGLMATCTAEGGFSHAFLADDPLARSPATAHTAGDEARICWSPGSAGTREAYVVTNRPDARVRCDVKGGLDVGILSTESPEVSLGARSIQIDRSTIPLPDEETGPIEGSDSEVAGMLLAIGYTTGDPALSGVLPCAP